MFYWYKRSVSGILVCAMLIALLSPVGSLVDWVKAVEVQGPALTSLSVDGGYALPFNAGQKSYEVRIPDGHPRVPQISAQCDGSCTVTLTQAVLPEGSTSAVASAVVTDAEGNSTEYKVTFVKDQAKGFHLQYNDYYTFRPDTTETVTEFVSSNSALASVSTEGVVQALALSDTAVTIEAKNAAGTTVDTLVIDKIVKAPLNIFLITGQSNAYGSYDIPTGTNEAAFTAAQLEKTLKPNPGTVLCTDVSNTGSILRDMYDLSAGRSGFSPALGKTWYELTGEKTLMLQTAVGGSPIEAWMKPEGGTRYTYNNAASNFYETTKNALEHTLEKVNAADSGYELNHIYAYWLQGETGMGNTYNPDKNGVGIGGWDLGSKEHILSSEEYYNIFMKNMEYFTDEFHVEFMGVLLARATQGVSSAESLSLQLLTDLVPTRAAQYALHNTNGTKITLVSRVCDIARMESYTDTTVEGYGFMGCDNLHYNQIGHNANGVAAATNSFYTLYNTKDRAATDIEIIKENGRDRFTEGETVEVSAGGTYQTAAMVLPMYTDTPIVTYEVADTTVCTIDKYGLITASEDALGKETTVTYKCEAADLTKTIKVKVTAVSASGTLNDSINWTLENGVLTITGTGDTPSYALADGSPFSEYAQDVTSVVVGEGITRLGNHLFYYMENIRSVQLPSTLVGINARAFGYCTKLTALTVPENVSALGLSAFNGSGITELHFKGNAPTSISGTKPCEGLTYTIYVPCSDNTWTNDKVTAIGGTAVMVEEHDYIDHVCSRCGGSDSVPVTGVALNKSELTLSVGGTETLTATVSPENATVTTVRWTSSDETVATVTNGVVNALKAGTTTITVTSVENGALSATCTVTVDAFSGASGTCGASISWTLADGVLTLTGTGATTEYTRTAATDTVNTPWWEMRASITKIVVGEGITNLDNYVFYGCTNVTEVTLPTTLERIETRVFKDFTKLTELTVNSNLTWLGLEAFVGSGITDLYFTGDAPAGFSGTKPCTGLTYNVHVPCDNETWTAAKLTAMGGTPTLVLVHDWEQGTYYEECRNCDAVNGVPVTGIALDKNTLTVGTGSDATLTATITPNNATVQTVVWTSSDPTVATVVNGVVTGLKAGTVTITAASAENSNLTAICTVTVEQNTSGACGANVNWTLVDGVLTLTGTGATTEYTRNSATDTANTPWWEDRVSITKIVVGEGITNIDNYVFYGCTNVTEVTLPTTLERIETRVFKDFTKLTELTVNSNLTWLGLEAFVGSGITDLYFTGNAPEGFSGTKPCTGMTYNIHVPCNNTTWTDTKLAAMGGTPTLVKTHNWPNGTCTACGASQNVPVSAVTLDKTTANITIADRLTLTATVSPANAADKSLTWTSSNETVATVSGGVVTPLKGGTVTITATARDGSNKSASCTITISDDVIGGTCGDSITWKLDNGVLKLTGTGSTTEFKRTAADNTVDTPWWNVRDLVTSIVVGEGITTVDNYAFYDMANVTSVTLPTTLERLETRVFTGCDKLKSLTISAGGIYLGYESFVGSGITDLYFTGEAYNNCSSTPPCKDLTFNLHTSCVATGWSAGKIGALGGTATQIVEHKWSGNKCSACGAKANNPVTAIRLDVNKATVYVDSTYAINAVVTPNDATDKMLEWTSSNEQIATVSPVGVVTGLKAGTVTITATAKDGSGVKATCTVTVKEGYGGNCGISAYWSFEKGVLTITGTGDLTIFTRNAQTDEINYPWAEIKDQITKVVIGEGITGLKNYAFYKCSSIAAVSLPSTLTVIAYGAFQGNTALKKITIPAAVKEFGSQVFKDSGLKEITFLGKHPASYGSNLFAGATLTAKYACSVQPADYGKNLTWVPYHNMKDVDGVTRCTDCGLVDGKQITGITLDVTELKLTVGQSVTLNAVISPADAAYAVLEWISSETAVVTVTADGVVTAIDPGSAMIIVKSTDGSGVEAVCKVSVREEGYDDNGPDNNGPQKPDDVQPDTTPNDQQQNNENSNGWILWVLLGGIAVVGAVLALLLGKKKKVRVNNQTDTK